MRAEDIRQKFFDFFESKSHKIVASAPVVLKNDPTLMFTNAGMNQFKDFFLGNKKIEIPRIADTQKCLRVSGKHNDLEEVGYDSYHHTLFEMLGNWSFGDYFKDEAISWAWELLTKVYELPEDRLYVTVFGGDENEGLGRDAEAANIWKRFLPEDKILDCGKKDNFWEMGDTGPCGPCSEIHVDLRSDEERAKKPGVELVNMDDPMVVELWNLVFIQFNRKANGSLEALPDNHIDTGMGFERLCMAMQGKVSNYDTDIFTPFIAYIEKATGIKYNGSYDPAAKTDVAMRVIVDHIRAVSFAIADGEMPSNTGAGYVIRRILRRAIRYYYSFLDVKEPFIYKMVTMLGEKFKSVFPELEAQHGFVEKVILEEEKSFLRTLEGGLKRMASLKVENNTLDGETAFELYDTYGFPIDLTRLIASEKSWTLDEDGFTKALNAQKERGRSDAKRVTGDWTSVKEIESVDFQGYDHTDLSQVYISRHRELEEKGKAVYQVVLDKTPFYAEGGGQVGDTGRIVFKNDTVKVINTVKENDLIIHIVDKLPSDVMESGEAIVDQKKRKLTENNHSATHLMHAALRQVLGTHVQQKGSLVKKDALRFDFSHFQKMSVEEVAQVEQIVNTKIRENIKLEEHRSISINEAKDAGAMMLFGEKYGDFVRMVTFDPDFSRELCGGCHVNATGEIGLFKIISEGAIASGIRRIEAVTADAAEVYVNTQITQLNNVKSMFKNSSQLEKTIADLIEENKELNKKVEKMLMGQASNLQSDLKSKAQLVNGVNLIAERLSLSDSKVVKTLAFNLEKDLTDAVILFGIEDGGKVQLMLTISKSLVESKSLNAGNMIRTLAKHIQGGGGGQAFFATAGGKDAAGIPAAINEIKIMLAS